MSQVSVCVGVGSSFSEDIAWEGVREFGVKASLFYAAKIEENSLSTALFYVF